MPYTDNTVGANTRNSAFVELLGTRKIFYFDILFSKSNSNEMDAYIYME